MRPRTIFATLASAALLAGTLAATSVAPAAATPVAANEATYTAFGRVFPDPHGCRPDGAPDTSPWAKGNVCAAQFIQWDEALSGVKFLEQRFPGYVQLINLRTQFGDLPALAQESLQSAGLPREDLSRNKRDLYVAKVTNVASPVPEGERRHFAYALSIHGIERAGIEGGIRAIEDLVSWAACENEDGNGSPVCADEGPFPKQILEPFDEDPEDPNEPAAGPTAGEVLDQAVIYFVLANPDGWHRGEVTEGGVFFQRYNGNGMDLNRDWPTIGYTEAQYTPFSEPESRGYGRFLKVIRDTTTEGRFAGAIDLHGMLTARAFSYTLLGAGQRDYRKNAITVDTSIRTFRDSERRLAWSPIIRPAEECPAGPTEPVFGGNVLVCSDQWGTVWDTINYQVSGSFGDWMDSPLGLDAVGIDNEMYVSHLAPNNHFDPDLEQLHIDGNKGLIYSQVASLLFEQPVAYEPGGHIAYIDDPERITNEGGEPAEPPTANLPTQDDLELTEVAGQGVEFEVLGPTDGFHNGGLTIEANFTNLRGVSEGSLATLVLDYCGPADHPGDPDGECREVARYFNQSAIYAQAGARIDLNDPRPGPYRIRPNSFRAGVTDYTVSFSRDAAFPVPEQAPYDVSRMDFFTELNGYVADGDPELEALRVDDVLADPSVLDRYDTVVAANDLMPGYVPPEEREGTDPEPAGEAQATQEYTLLPPETGAPSLGATGGSREFEVEDGFDNDRMVVEATWQTPSDYDLRVDKQLEDGSWEERGSSTQFITTGERVTIADPEPGAWRFRIENFAAAPQPVDVTVSFEAEAEEGTEGTPTLYSDAERDAYLAALADWVAGGGNLTLTDAAMDALPDLAPGIADEDVTGGFFYAGWMDFNDGDGPTYPDRETGEGGHHLAAGVNKEGTAEGRAELDGTEFVNRHQTTEPTPLGHYVSPSGSANSDCGSDRCDSPNWVVAQEAWEAAGGTTAARTFVRESTSQGSPGTMGVSLGELALGEGVVRIGGALLPDPSEENYHPFGLSSYALTYTGYQVFENLTTHTNPNRVEAGEPAPAVTLDCGDCAVEVRAGESGTQELTVTNTGNVADTYDLAVTDAPDGWETSVEPAEVQLEPGASATATLTVSPPRKAKKGDNDVVVTATSRNHEGVADDATVAVTVTKGRPSDAGPSGAEAGGAGTLVAGIAERAPAALTGLVLLAAALVAGALAVARHRRRRLPPA